MTRTRAAYLVAAAIFALGVGATVHAVRATPAAMRRMQRKAADLEELRALERGRETLAAAIAAYDQLASKKARPVAELAERAGIAAKPAVRRRDPRPAAAGWVSSSLTVTFEDLPLSQLPAFIAEASAAGSQPPWQLVECSITALDQGRGRVVLTLEALER